MLTNLVPVAMRTWLSMVMQDRTGAQAVTPALVQKMRLVIPTVFA